MPDTGRIRCLISSQLLRYLCALLIVSTAAGCHHGRIAARNITSDLIPTPVKNAQTVDLSKLASFDTNRSRIGRGDALEVTISAGLGKDDTVTVPCRVSEDGLAMVPSVGRVPLAGLELETAEAVIAEAAVERGLYRAPTVVVSMKAQSVNRVTVVGAVKEPGVKELPRGGSDLLSALVAAGGLEENAGTAVELRRDPANLQPRPHTPIAGRDTSGITAAGHSLDVASNRLSVLPAVQQVDLAAIAKSGTGSNALQLGDGDVVFVEKRDPLPIYVQGVVHKPGEVEVPVGRELKVTDAVALAGGVSSPVADKVFVIRQLPNMNAPKVIQVSLRRAKQFGNENLVLAPGDRVSVEQTPATVLMDIIRLLNFGVGASLNTLF